MLHQVNLNMFNVEMARGQSLCGPGPAIVCCQVTVQVTVVWAPGYVLIIYPQFTRAEPTGGGHNPTSPVGWSWQHPGGDTRIKQIEVGSFDCAID